MRVHCTTFTRRRVLILAMLAMFLFREAATPPARAQDDAAAVAAPGAGVAPALTPLAPRWMGAYRATFTDDDDGLELVVPRFVKAAGGRRSLVQVMNLGTGTANVQLQPRDASNAALACGAPCSATIAPLAAALFDSATLPLPVGLTGSARVTSGPGTYITAVVLELDGNTAGPDVALDNAISRQFPGGTALRFAQVPLGLAAGALGTGSTTLRALNPDAVTPLTVSGNVWPGALPLAPQPVPADTVAPLSLPGAGDLAATVQSGPAMMGAAESVDWTNGGREALGNAWVGDAQSLPLVLKNVNGRCSSIAVFETNGQAAQLTLDLRAEGAAAPAPGFPTTLPIAANGLLRWDLCTDPLFAALPAGFVGAMRLTVPSAQPGAAIAASTRIQSADGRAVAAYEGTWRSEGTVRAPLVHTAWPTGVGNLTMDSTIAVMNLGGATTAQVQVVGAPGSSCAGMSFTHGPKALPANGMVTFDQRLGGGSGLPAGCNGSAVIQAANGRIAAVVLDEAFAPTTCEMQRVHVGGNDDTFVTTNGPEPSAPGPELSAVVSGPMRAFDQPGINMALVHTFPGLHIPGWRILTAELELRAKPEGDASNDAINVGLFEPSASSLPTVVGTDFFGSGNSAPGRLPNVWNQTNYPSGSTFNLDLTAAPYGAPVITAMDQRGRLDVYIQDDTNVDYLKLTLCYERTCKVTEVFLGGADDAMGPTADPAPFQSTGLLAYLGPQTSRAFDAPGDDKLLAHSFMALNKPGHQIAGATLEVRAAPDSGLYTNDVMHLGAAAAIGWNPIFSMPFNWTAMGAQTFSLDLATVAPAVLGHIVANGYLDVYIQDDTKVDFLRLTVRYTCCETQLGGDKDSFATPPGPTTSPSAQLTQYLTTVVGYPPAIAQPFDATSSNGYFAHSFGNVHWPGYRICSASLTIGLRTLSGAWNNDSMTVGVIRPNGSSWLAPKRLVAPLWPTATASPQTLTLDISNIGWLMDIHNRLDIWVQDDTAVDYVELTVCHCPPGPWNPTNTSATTVSTELPKWPGAAIADGKGETVWSSAAHSEHLAGAEWAAVRLMQKLPIDGLRIIPRTDPSDAALSLGFPKDFVLQYSDNSQGRTCDPARPEFGRDSNWRPLVTRYGFPQPVADPLLFTFAPREAECVRIFGAELSQDDYGNRYLQLADVEVLSAGTVARAAGVAASSSLPRWGVERLVDGDPATAWSSRLHGEHLAGAEWAAVILPAKSPLDTAWVLPRADPANAATSLGFPKDLVLQYSDDSQGRTCDPLRPEFSRDSNWRPLATRYGFPQPSSAAVVFRFPTKEARCVRLFGAELSQDDYGNRYLQLAALSVGLGEAVTPASGVAVSSALGSWPAARLIDGDPATAWSSRAHTEHLAGAEWAVVHLPQSTPLDGLRIIPRTDPSDAALSLGFPKDFVLQYSDNTEGRTCDPARPEFGRDSNWRPLGTYYGFEQPAAAAVEFTFTPRQARCVRVFGAELSQDDYGNRYLQLGEVQLRSGEWLQPPAPDTSAAGPGMGHLP